MTEWADADENFSVRLSVTALNRKSLLFGLFPWGFELNRGNSRALRLRARGSAASGSGGCRRLVGWSCRRMTKMLSPTRAFRLSRGMTKPNRQNLLFGLFSWGFKLNGGNFRGLRLTKMRLVGWGCSPLFVLKSAKPGFVRWAAASVELRCCRLWLTKIQSRSGGKMAASVELRCYGLSWV